MRTHDLILEARLQEIRPSIWRLVRVPGRYNLKQLHRILQILFGWQDYHLHEFELEDERFGDPETDEECERDETEFKLAQLRKRTVFSYRYDFGDDWHVRLQVRDLVPSEEAVQGPRLMDGKRAGPPEDCGGTPGYQNLVAAVRHPRDEEQRELKVWAGDWDPERFLPEALQAALDRRFRVRRPAPRRDTPREVWLQPSPEQLEALRRGTGSPPLESYNLAGLKVRELLLAVLLSEGPKTLEEVACRLGEAGVDLPHGVESVRRSWRRASLIRQRLDGRLEVVPEDPELWYPLAGLRDNLDRKYPEIDRRRAARGLTAEVPPVETGPITWDELLEPARSGHRLPFNMAMRRWIMLCLEARGGRRAEEDLARDLRELGLHADGQNLIKSLAAKNLPVGREPSGSWWVDSSREEVKAARQAFRKWWAPWKQALEHRGRMNRSTEDRKRERAEQEQAHRDWFSSTSRALFRAIRHGEDVAAAMLHLVTTPEGEAVRLESFTPEDRGRLVERLRGMGILIGLDPRGELERLGLTVGNQRVLDVSPPFRTRATGHRRRSFSTEEILRMTVPEYPPGLSERLEEWARAGRWDTVLEALAEELAALHSWYRYGVSHGYILCREEGWMEPVNVAWNLGLEPTLRDCLACAAERKRPIAIQRFSDAHLRSFRPGAAPEHERVHGTWQDTGRSEPVLLPEIRAFQFVWEGPLPEKHMSALLLHGR